MGAGVVEARKRAESDGGVGGFRLPSSGSHSVPHVLSAGPWDLLPSSLAPAHGGGRSRRPSCPALAQASFSSKHPPLPSRFPLGRGRALKP